VMPSASKGPGYEWSPTLTLNPAGLMGKHAPPPSARRPHPSHAAPNVGRLVADHESTAVAQSVLRIWPQHLIDDARAPGASSSTRRSAASTSGKRRGMTVRRANGEPLHQNAAVAPL